MFNLTKSKQLNRNSVFKLVYVEQSKYKISAKIKDIIK